MISCTLLNFFMKQHKFILIFFMLLATSFMSFKPFMNNPSSPILIEVAGIILFIYCFNTIFGLHTHHIIFRKSNVWILFSFFLSMLSSYILYKQGIYQSLKAISPLLFCCCLYFLCIKWHIQENFIIRFLIVFSIVFTTAEMIQQLTYPEMWFNGRPPNETTGRIEQRMGLWRFYIFGIDYCMLACLFCFQKTLEGLKKYLWLLIISFVGIVFFVARKNIFAIISCFIVGILFSSKKSSVYNKILFSIFIMAIVIILPIYMTDLIAQTTDEINDEDFVRYMAANYFIYDFNDSPLYVLFGSGRASGNSQLAQEISYLIEQFRYYKSDCGFIGYYSDFGLFGIAAMLYLIFQIIKNYKFIDSYLLLYLFLRIEISFFDFWGNYPRNFATWFIYLYLIECSINRNKQKQLFFCRTNIIEYKKNPI